jgi:hypothetical protein
MTHGTSPWKSNIATGDIIIVRLTLRMGRKEIMVHYQTIESCHNRHNGVNGGFIPIASEPLSSYLFIPSRHASRTLFLIDNLSP